MKRKNKDATRVGHPLLLELPDARRASATADARRC